MATCLLGLGSNLGDRVANLTRAIALLDSRHGQRVIARSDWYRTRPVGGPGGQGEFVNAAVRLQTSLSPVALLQTMRDIETELGRQQRERWAARLVDLDLLLYDDLVLQTATIAVPHPRMAFRRFVLEPAAEVGAELQHPVFRRTMRELLDRLNSTANYLSLTGPAGVGKSHWVQTVAEKMGGVVLDVSPHNAASRADAASVADAELALIARRAGMLAAAAWPHGSQFVCSDFWIGQSRIYARRNLPADQAVRVERALIARMSQVVRPKLLVLIGDGEMLAELRQAAVEWGECPFLELSTGDPQWMLTELLAAAEAMQ